MAENDRTYIARALNFIGLQRRMAVSNSPNDPLWANLFTSAKTASGITISTDEKAMQCSAVYACIRVLAEAAASLPLFIYKRNPDRSREVAEKHYLNSILHDKPNEFQTSYEFRETMMAHLCLRGNFYAYKEMNGGGQIVNLIPLNPTRMKVSRNNQTLEYEYTDDTGSSNYWTAKEIWHIKGISSDGVLGFSPVTIAREQIGLALKMEEHGARVFSNYARPSGILSTPGKLSENAADRLKKSWYQAQGGDNVHKVAVVEEGLTWTSIGYSNEDSQFLESRNFQIEDIARIFKVPSILINHSDKSATYASVEQQMLSFVIHSLRPWLVRIEQSINKNLLTDAEKKQGYFAEHKLEGLLRGDIQARYSAYAIGRQNGWLSANEIRELENLNPIEGGNKYDNPMVTPSPAQIEGKNNNDDEERKIQIRTLELVENIVNAHKENIKDIMAKRESPLPVSIAIENPPMDININHKSEPVNVNVEIKQKKTITKRTGEARRDKNGKLLFEVKEVET